MEQLPNLGKEAAARLKKHVEVLHHFKGAGVYKELHLGTVMLMLFICTWSLQMP